MNFIQTSAAIVPNVSGASGYQANDVLGNEFKIPLAGGAYGGLIEHALLIDRGTGNVDMRAHMFNAQPSAYSPSGVAFALAATDDNKYIGSIDFTIWSARGADNLVSMVNAPGVGIYARSGARDIWCVLQTLENVTAGDIANGMRLSMVVRQDC